jgi:hypothetical protein
MVVQFQEESDSLALDLLKSIAIGLVAVVLGSLIWAAIAYYLDRVSLWVAWLIGASVAYALFLPFKRINIGVILFLLPITLLVTLACVVVGDAVAIVFTVLADPTNELTLLQTALAAVISIPDWLFEREILVTLVLGAIGSLMGFLAVARRTWRRGKRLPASSKPVKLADASNVPSHFVSVDNLGAAQHVFTINKANQASIVVVFTLMAAFIVWLLWSAVRDANLGNNLTGVIIGAALFLGLLALCGYYVVRTLMRWRESAVIYDNGFAHFDGKHLRAWAWHEIASIKADVREILLYGIVKTGTRHRYTLTHTNGEALKLKDELKNVAQFVQILQQQSAKAVRARAVEQLERGDMVSFGKIALNRDGIRINEHELLPWHEIANVSLSDGTLTIKRADNALFPNISVSAAHIENLDLFMSLLFDESQK